MLDKKNEEKIAVAKAAVSFVKENDVVGLGTGSTATFAINELGVRVKNGLNIWGVPSSLATKALATSLGIPLLELGEVAEIDISIDGADEFTLDLHLIKGGGGALFREKIVASLSKHKIIIVDSSKKVDKLGAFKVPIEVVAVAHQYVVNQIELLGGIPKLRQIGNQIFITDNGNIILDVNFGLINDPSELSRQLNQIEGVLAHGLFINLTSQVINSVNGELVTYRKK